MTLCYDCVVHILENNLKMWAQVFRWVFVVSEDQSDDLNLDETTI